MTSHTQLAAMLLRDAAGFFRNVGDQNDAMREEMYDNADVYEQVARLIEEDPMGQVDLVDD